MVEEIVHFDGLLRNRRIAETLLSPAVGEGTHHAVLGYPEHYWCRLETEDAYRQESARMSNCVGWASTSYRSRYIGKPWPVGIWSLRKGGESLVTAELDVRHGVTVNIGGSPYSAHLPNMTMTDDEIREALPMAIMQGTQMRRVEVVAVHRSSAAKIIQALAAHNRPVPPKLAGAVDALREIVRVATARAAA